MKTETSNGFTVELTGHGYGTRTVYIYSPIGYCIFSKVYEWHQYQLAEAEYHALIAFCDMRIQTRQEVA